ncbi:hypothetical protein BKA67DRAFT_551044 [Truncatella angustata]|uniref:Uncharacterized protein n=1 Tax=Truncatella angustata TaxID=152316 RepID=A0A9P9A5J1_9PEZI|nr:uncharacterized protein BKA67DRAFT_551044 [Truncatella angustata]KAH6661385.1 hypothetical protein BKA67DRAFT_551044 [Truncatella angustata]KAH8200245.1 hypothetical protein TruAng_005581 [Truncatella angustata]
MSHDTKGPVSTSEFEVDPQDLQHHSHLRTIRLVDGARVGLTLLALLSGITILGTSGHALDVYNNTSLATNFLLPLWPDEFDARPTVALVIGSAIVVLASILSLAFSKTASLRSRVAIHTPLTLVTPFVGFTASTIAMILFYAVNTSSTVDTLQSWSCQWESIEMTVQPYFGTLCRESKTALYLSVILVPVEAVILSLAGYQLALEKKAAGLARSTKRGSPTPSA